MALNGYFKILLDQNTQTHDGSLNVLKDNKQKTYLSDF